MTARLDLSQIPEPAEAKVPLESTMHISAPLVMSQRLKTFIRFKVLEVPETVEAVVLYNIGVGPCSFRVVGGKTNRKSMQMSEQGFGCY